MATKKGRGREGRRGGNVIMFDRGFKLPSKPGPQPATGPTPAVEVPTIARKFFEATGQDYNRVVALAGEGRAKFHCRDFAHEQECNSRQDISNRAYAEQEFSFACVLNKRREFYKAMKCFRRALQSDKTYAEAHFELAQLYLKFGWEFDAVEHFTAYRQYGTETWKLGVAEMEIRNRAPYAQHSLMPFKFGS
jgi:tetratricopeptide (TPR) repeat protein